MRALMNWLICSCVFFTLNACDSSASKKAEEQGSKIANEALKKAFGGDMFKAADKGDIEALKKGLEAGEDVNQKNAYSQTPLMRAAKNGQKEAVKFLLDNGADKTIVDIYEHDAATIAGDYGHDDIRELIENYPAEEK